MSEFNLGKIQKIIKEMNCDGWLFYDFRRSNELAMEIMKVANDAHLTRRLFYFIPKEGNPTKIVNGIEAWHLDHLPGNKLTYSSHSSLSNHLKNTLKNSKVIVMEYSPMNAIPYVSKVDAGTIEQIKSLGIEIKSSGDLISMFAATWSEEQYKENIPVAEALTDIVHLSFDLIKDNLLKQKKINEFDVQEFIMSEFEKRKYYTDSPPIVGVNENSGNPHYTPTSEINRPINKEDFVLIDLWAKVDKPSGVWADITWVGFAGNKVPGKYTDIFNIVAEARDTAFNLVVNRFKENKVIRGFEVDDAAREVIVKAGYGDYFIHRTGHSITTELHGSGAHMDDYETKDERILLPSTSFSIEPGIYLNEFGVRSEIDVYINPKGEVIATGKEKQTSIIPILA